MSHHLTKLVFRTRLAILSRRPENGATAVEYALMVTFIAIVIIVAVLTLGNKLSSFFNDAAVKV